MNEDVTRFDEFGYLVVRDGFDVATIQNLRKLVLAGFDRLNSNVIGDAILHYPEMFGAVKRSKIIGVLNRLLGKPFLLVLSSANRNFFGQFHTDSSGMERNGCFAFRDPAFRSVTVAIYLQDNNEAGGGIRLVPGSHLKKDPFPPIHDRRRKDRKAIQKSLVKRVLHRASGGKLFNVHYPELDDQPGQVDVATKAGDVVLWDVRMFHRASPKRSDAQALPGGKVALFFEAARDNDIVRNEYLPILRNTPDMKKFRPGPVALPAANENFITV